jgi:hypothetical protein
MDERRDLLKSLVDFTLPASSLRERLAALPWDSEGVVSLSASQVLQILKRFLDGRISVVELAEWADLIEGREDIEFEKDFDSLLKQLIFEFANPALTREKPRDVALKWIDRLTAHGEY